MVFIKGMQPTKGFTGKKHSDKSKMMMSEGQRLKWEKIHERRAEAWAAQDDMAYSASDGLDPFEYD